jgi:hypothetical protein
MPPLLGSGIGVGSCVVGGRQRAICNGRSGGYGGWEREEEDGAVVQFAFGVDGTGVREHDVFRDCETESGAAGFAGARFVDAIKAFEEA